MAENRFKEQVWHLAALGIKAGEAGDPGLGQAQLCGLAQQHRLQLYIQHPHRRRRQRLHPPNR